MTATITKGRDSYISTLPETTTYQSAESNADLTRAAAKTLLEDLLPRLADEHTPEDAENNYAAQALTVSAALGRDVNRWEVRDAMEALNAMSLLNAGNCLMDLYGHPNTDENRDYWLAYEQMNLTVAVQNLVAGVPA